MKIDFQRRLMVFMSICTLISGNSRVISSSELLDGVYMLVVVVVVVVV